jgi:hypothetical protein
MDLMVLLVVVLTFALVWLILHVFVNFVIVSLYSLRAYPW